MAPMTLDDFAERLEAVVKQQVEIEARVRDDFSSRIEALLTEAKGDAEDLSEKHQTLFQAAMARLLKLVEEV